MKRNAAAPGRTEGGDSNLATLEQEEQHDLLEVVS